jgi:glycosidase
LTVPAWVKDAIFYQIFPDRFANGDKGNDPPNVQPWGTRPSILGFQGGDLQGVIDRLDYIRDLGANAIYLNPIFLATSTHRYNTSDYYRIDPKLGSMEDFHRLLELAHQHGIRIILDGVFNHCGRGFFAFNDLLENQEHSPYRDWFHVKSFPLDAYGGGQAKNYRAWWKFKSLPKFNTTHPPTKKYLFDVGRYWIEQGADGWRLDVPIEIEDATFWAEFREIVKGINPQAYLVGEIWEADPSWVGPENFDGLMNYPLRDAIIDFLVQKKLKASEFAKGLLELLHLYSTEHAFAHLLPLGSHDTRRILTVCENRVEIVRQALVIQFSFPGAPVIYYGDEIGLEGEKDPDNRRAFPWDKSKWDEDMLGFVRQLVSLRHECPSLRRGDFQVLLTDDDTSIVAFTRVLESDITVTTINASTVPQRIRLPAVELSWTDGQEVVNVLGGDRFVVADGHLEMNLPPHGFAMLRLPD